MSDFKIISRKEMQKQLGESFSMFSGQKKGKHC